MSILAHRRKAFQTSAGGGLPITSGRFLHLDASDAGSVTLNGSAVGAIADLSGLGVSVGQVTAARQPAYVTAAVNGLNAMEFTAASSHFLDVGAITIPASHTVFIVLARPTSGIHSIGLGNASGAIHTPWWYTDNVIYQGSNSTYTTHGAASTATGTFILTIRRNGTSQIRVRRNGSTVADVTTGAGVTSAASGTWVYLGRTAGAYMNGSLCEIVGYDTSFSDGDVDSTESSLTSKWL